ncbi:MAG: hypothetical protein ACRD4I_01595 [Candidatus Angelobacter sp.]
MPNYECNLALRLVSELYSTQDKMEVAGALVAQTQTEGLPIVSANIILDSYGVRRLWYARWGSVASSLFDHSPSTLFS